MYVYIITLYKVFISYNHTICNIFKNFLMSYSDEEFGFGWGSLRKEKQKQNKTNRNSTTPLDNTDKETKFKKTHVCKHLQTSSHIWQLPEDKSNHLATCAFPSFFLDCNGCLARLLQDLSPVYYLYLSPSLPTLSGCSTYGGFWFATLYWLLQWRLTVACCSGSWQVLSLARLRRHILNIDLWFGCSTADSDLLWYSNLFHTLIIMYNISNYYIYTYINWFWCTHTYI